MKNTPSVNPQPSANGNGQRANFTITPGEPIPVSKLIEQAKLQNPDAIKEPTTYPQPVKQDEAKTPTPPAAPVAPAPAVVEPVKATDPARSRAEEIEFQIQKSQTLQLINTQLQSLKSKHAELKQFSYAVDKDDDSRYGHMVIYDDNNREFTCKNHGLASLIVEHLKAVFEKKIEEKENELLVVSKS